MKIQKNLLSRIVVLGLLLSTTFTVFSAEAADKQKKKEEKPKGPIVVQAEELSFSDLTGDIFAKGNVTVLQDKDQLLGDLVRGNTRQTQLWIDGNATYIEPESGTQILGTQLQYNYNEHTGTMAKATGKSGRDFLSGHTIDIMPDEVIIHDGTMTACPAKIPDYHISAKRIEIWPGDKMIAYDAKFWIKDKVLYSMPRYQKSLKQGANDSEMPVVGYDNDDGLQIKQHMEYPLTNNTAAFADLNYYSARGLKPDFGLKNTTRNFSTKLLVGEDRDSDGKWIKKEPELRLDYYSHRLGNAPVSYSGYAIYGDWKDGSKKSWHQEYYMYFSRDPVILDSAKTLKLYLGTGFKHTQESYDNSIVNTYNWDATLGKTWSPKLYTWTAYHYTQNTSSLFDYNNTDLGRQLDMGFTYTFDKKNALTFVQTYDVVNDRIYDQDYTWHRNLHCWQADITYRAKRHQLNWKIALAHW